VWLTVLLSRTTICVSAAVLRDISWMPLVRSKCVIIHNGISCGELLSKEEARSALAPRTVARYWIGMISELHPTKRIDDALRAFALLAKRHPESALIIIGEGELRSELEQLIRDLQMTRRIILLGAVIDAARYLRAFDLFLHSSLSEALPYAPLEAGCASLPVVATKVGGIPEIIPDEDHGLLVPPQMPEALATAMESLMSEPQRAAEMGARLHARIRQSFSKEAMVARTLALYTP
jgi:glycosyltransferase involved in cell wall biosynthesis